MLNRIKMVPVLVTYWVNRLTTRGETGASLVEYALLLALIAVAAAAALASLGTTVSNSISNMSKGFVTTTTGGS